MYISLPIWLTKEISNRIVSRLNYTRIAPKKISINSHFDLSLIKDLYPKTKIVCRKKNDIYFILRQLLNSFLFKKKENQNKHIFDLFISNLELQNALFFQKEISNWKSLLKPNGLLMFSYFGPDTFKELQALDSTTLQSRKYPDMHHIGDILLQEGFINPVIEMEYINLKYKNFLELMNDIRNLNIFEKEVLEKIQRSNNKISDFDLTLEIIYGHAWISKKIFFKITKNNKKILK